MLQALQDVVRVNYGEVEALEKALPAVLDLLSSPQAKECHRASCRLLTSAVWPKVVDQSDALVKETTDIVSSWTRLTDDSEGVTHQLRVTSQSLAKMAANDLPTMSLEELQEVLDGCKEVFIILYILCILYII